jgi:methionyl-tRNA formyltransferase
MQICIAGKNKCAVDFVKLLISQVKYHFEILILPNSTDTGQDGWQPSLKKFAKETNLKIIDLKYLYKIKNLIFISIEFDKIVKTENFITSDLYNFHFSLLPKYRGCHTSFLQLYNGEEYSGVTLHKIDSGIDTGDIIDQIRFKINLNDTSFENYCRLMDASVKLFKKNLYILVEKKYLLLKQNLSEGSYFSRKSVNYKDLLNINIKKEDLFTHNKIRALIFPAFQYPVVNGKKVKKSIFYNNKIILEYLE